MNNKQYIFWQTNVLEAQAETDFSEWEVQETKEQINTVSEKIEPSIVKAMCPLGEIKRITTDCRKSWKKAVIIVRNKEISIFIHNYISNNNLDNKDYVDLINIHQISDEIITDDYNKCIFFDVPNLWKNNKSNEWLLERVELKRLKTNFPYIQPEFVLFSRKWLDNWILWETVQSLYETKVDTKEKSSSIHSLLNNSEHWVTKEIVLEPSLEYIDNTEQATSLNQIEELVLAEVQKYPKIKFFWYVKNNKQKLIVEKKCKKLNIDNIELIVSNEIWYHDWSSKNGTAFFSDINSLDKITKAYKNIIKNKKNQQQLTISVNNRIASKKLDTEIFNRIQNTLLENNRSQKQWKRKNISTNEDYVLPWLQSTWWSLKIVDSHSTNSKYIIDFNILQDEELIKEIMYWFQSYTPKIEDIAMLQSIGYWKIRKQIKALDTFFKKYKKYNYSVFEDPNFQYVLWIFQKSEYYKKKVKDEMQDVFWVLSGIDFLKIWRRNFSRSSTRNNKAIPYLVYTQQDLNKNSIKHITWTNHIRLTQYIYWDDFSIENISKQVQSKFEELGIRLLLKLLEVLYPYRSSKKEITTLIDIQKYLQSFSSGDGLLHHPVINILKSGDFNSDSLLKVSKLVYKNEHLELEKKLKDYAIAEIDNTFKDADGNSINPFLITWEEFRQKIWKENKTAFKLLVHILSDDRFPEIKLDEDSQNISTSKAKFTKEMQGDIADYLGYEYPIMQIDSQEPEKEMGETNPEKNNHKVLITKLIPSNKLDYKLFCKKYSIIYDSINSSNIIALCKKFKIDAIHLERALHENFDSNIITLRQMFSWKYIQSIERKFWNPSWSWFFNTIIMERDKK